MVNIMILEKDGAIAILQQIFVNRILELFELWVNYYKCENPEDTTELDNKEGAEALLQSYFKRAPEDIYKYLKTTKKSSSTSIVPKEKIVSPSHPMPN